MGVEGATTLWVRTMAQKALELEPTNLKALFRRGCSYANDGIWHLAQKDFENILQLDPSNEAAVQEMQKIQSYLSHTSASTAHGDDDAVASTDESGKSRVEDPSEVRRRVLRRIEQLKSDILEMAEAKNTLADWSHWLKKLEEQSREWAKHQLLDPEMLEDLQVVYGDVFVRMDDSQKEDFIMAYELEQELRRSHNEIEVLFRPMEQDERAEC